MKEKFVLFLLLKLLLHKAITDYLHNECLNTKSSQEKQRENREKEITNSCGTHIKGIKSETFLYYLFWHQD